MPVIPENVECLNDCFALRACKFGGANPNVLNEPDWQMKQGTKSAKHMFETCLFHQPPYLVGEYDIVMEACAVHWKDKTGDCFNLPSASNIQNNRKGMKKIWHVRKNV